MRSLPWRRGLLIAVGLLAGLVVSDLIGGSGWLRFLVFVVIVIAVFAIRDPTPRRHPVSVLDGEPASPPPAGSV